MKNKKVIIFYLPWPSAEPENFNVYKGIVKDTFGTFLLVELSHKFLWFKWKTNQWFNIDNHHTKYKIIED